MGGIWITGGLRGKNGLSVRVQPCDEDTFGLIGEGLKVIRYNIRAHSNWKKKSAVLF